MSKIKDNFETGYFWEYYMDLERQFIDFLNHVPYLDGNEKVYSFRLMNLILAIGAHVGSAIKEMFRCSDFSAKYPKILKKVDGGKAAITDYRELEKEYCLSKREVVFKRLPERENILPFQQFESSSSPSPTTWPPNTEPAPFPTILVAATAVASVAVVDVGLLVYFKKRNR